MSKITRRETLARGGEGGGSRNSLAAVPTIALSSVLADAERLAGRAS